MDVLARIAVATEDRGPHAFGFAWIDGRGGLHNFKQAGRLSENIDRITMLEDARLLIGHARWATHGRPEVNRNNHPHRAGGGWIVHNGIFRGHERIAKRFNVRMRTECDSEVIGAVIGRSGGTALERTCLAVRSGMYSPLVVLGLWREIRKTPARMTAVRQAGQPLCCAGTRHGSYLASLDVGLPGKVIEMPDDWAWEFGVGGCRGKREVRHPLRESYLRKEERWGRTTQGKFREFKTWEDYR